MLHTRDLNTEPKILLTEATEQWNSTLVVLFLVQPILIEEKQVYLFILYFFKWQIPYSRRCTRTSRSFDETEIIRLSIYVNHLRLVIFNESWTFSPADRTPIILHRYVILLLIGLADKRSQLAQRTLQEADGAQIVGTAVIAAMAILICLIVIGDAGTVLTSLRIAFGTRT